MWTLFRDPRRKRLEKPSKRAADRSFLKREKFVPAGPLADGQDTIDVLSLAGLLAPESRDDASALDVKCVWTLADAEGSDQAFLIRVDLGLGDQPSVQYVYKPHVEAARARMLQSLGYIHHALHTWLHDEGDRDVFSGIVSAYVDAGDEALLPGTIGYDRARGNGSVHLIPDVHFYMTQGYAHLRSAPERSWSEKQPRFVWRGSTTGAGSLDCESIIHLPRYGLCLAAQKFRGAVDAGFTAVVQSRSDEDADALRAHFASLGIWREWTEIAQYRYVIDIDGNAGSWGFFEKLLTGSCVAKVESSHEQWFYKDLKPWLHYIPISRDLSNLDEVVNWCFENDEGCRAIGEAGRAFALERDFPSQMSLAATTLVAASSPRKAD